MNPQIEQLRKQFNGYNNAQKKQFIDNLKIKLQGKNNPEYSKFLNECIQSYNASMRGGVSVVDDFSSLLDTPAKSGKGGGISLFTLKLWAVISGGVGILMWFVLPFAREESISSFVSFGVRHSYWMHSGYQTANSLLTWGLRVEFSFMSITLYLAMVLLAIVLIALISSNWKTRLCFTGVIFLQAWNIVLYFYVLVAHANYDLTVTRATPTFYSALILLLSVVSIVVSIKGRKKC